MVDEDVLRVVRAHLPLNALEPDARAYGRIVFHVVVILAACIATNQVASSWWLVLLLLSAVNMSALPFLAHDLSHRTITTNRYVLYPTELVLFSLLFLPPTLWRKVHGSHHAHTNAFDDPDRRFLDAELAELPKRVTAALLFPNRAMRFLPTYLLYWLVFPFRHGITAFYPGRAAPPFAAAKPIYSSADKIRIALELAVIAFVQFGLWSLGAGNAAFVCISVVPVVFASMVVSLYVCTNHGLFPVVKHNRDTLETTTSVVVPRFFDKLHSNFSYHAEHHSFPTMNSRYYPRVSAILQKHFPHRYHRMPIGRVWFALLRNAIGDLPHTKSNATRVAFTVLPEPKFSKSAGDTMSTGP
jgi:fatty acid desaturase